MNVRDNNIAKQRCKNIPKLEENTRPDEQAPRRFRFTVFETGLFTGYTFFAEILIHPNGWTISIFVLPLIAGRFPVRGDYVSVAIGAAIFQAFSILDGCDGDCAPKIWNLRLGERLDYFFDFAASLVYVLTLGLGLHRSSEELRVLF